MKFVKRVHSVCFNFFFAQSPQITSIYNQVFIWFFFIPKVFFFSFFAVEFDVENRRRGIKSINSINIRYNWSVYSFIVNFQAVKFKTFLTYKRLTSDLSLWLNFDFSCELRLLKQSISCFGPEFSFMVNQFGVIVHIDWW